jgi:hypothetical protein
MARRKTRQRTIHCVVFGMENHASGILDDIGRGLSPPRDASRLVHVLDCGRRGAEGALRQGCRHELVEVAVEHA